MEVIDSLVAAGALTADAAMRVEQAVNDQGQSYEDVLREAQVPDDAVRDAFAAYYSIPPFAMGEHDQIEERVLNLIPEDSARHYELLPIRVDEGILVVGVNDPENLQMREALNFISQKNQQPYRFVFMLKRDLLAALDAYNSLSGEVDSALGSLENELNASIAEKEHEQSSDENESLEHLKEDAPVTKIVATILRYAIDGGASDIHIEPTGEKVVVRFRVDGVLQKSLELPHTVQSAVVARVKILSSMRLDERRKPQDGRFSTTFDGRKIDFRVSVLPTNHGEKVVMRILDNSRGITSLESTGILTHHVDTIRRMVKEPYGIILISGPTGSGKSTTLYAMMGEVDTASKNVLSLEDPVEYNITGVSQSQVRPEIGYTFASGLRSALRQDPDIIMVGEIRDKETAQLAIQAALTGHLVLSTIHTNNAIGVIPRLIDMGVDPYLIAPTLKLCIAQRLARRLCNDAGEPIPVEGPLKERIDRRIADLPERFRKRIPDTGTMLHPTPAPGCATGTKGRVAIMEILEVDERIQELILKGGSEEDIYKEARTHGFMTMEEDAIVKALDHVIPYEEMTVFGSKINLEDDEEVEPVLATSVPLPVESEEAPAAEAPPPPAAVDNLNTKVAG